MAKIQYIKPSSSSIEYESSGSSYSYGSRPLPPKRTDPAFKVLGSIGMVGFLVAVLALVITIVSLQAKKDANTILTESFVNRLHNAENYLAKHIELNSLEKLRSAFKSLVDSYKGGAIRHRSMLRYTDAVWQDILQQEPSRALLVAILHVSEEITGVTTPEVTNAIDYFKSASDSAVLSGGSRINTNDEPLFPIIGDTFGESRSKGSEGEIPPFSLE